MKTGFGHFLDFGTWDGLDIAYYDSTKLFERLVMGSVMLCLINYAELA